MRRGIFFVLLLCINNTLACTDDGSTSLVEETQSDSETETDSARENETDTSTSLPNGDTDTSRTDSERCADATIPFNTCEGDTLIVYTGEVSQSDDSCTFQFEETQCASGCLSQDNANDVCSDATGFVHGDIAVSPGGVATFHGALSTTTESDVYGNCRVADDILEFTVAHASYDSVQDTIGISSPVFLSIKGITGPSGHPIEGVYDYSDTFASPEIKHGAAYVSSFESVALRNIKDSWAFFADNDMCAVHLFAVPAEGELIFEQGLSLPFDYYVNLSCNGMDSVTGENDTNLSAFSASLYFANCTSEK